MALSIRIGGCRVWVSIPQYRCAGWGDPDEADSGVSSPPDRAVGFGEDRPTHVRDKPGESVSVAAASGPSHTLGGQTLRGPGQVMGGRVTA